MRSKRFEILGARPVNKDGYVKRMAWSRVNSNELSFRSKTKCESRKWENSWTWWKERENFDLLDYFIADYGIIAENAEKVMAMDSTEIARKFSWYKCIERWNIENNSFSYSSKSSWSNGGKWQCWKWWWQLTKWEQEKLHQTNSHVTNIKDNPVQIAADAAEGSLRGFSEEETTVAVARYAPLMQYLY